MKRIGPNTYVIRDNGNRAKGRISKGCFKKAKHAKISEKQTFLTQCAYQGVTNVCFSEILACFAFLKHPF